MTTAQEFTAPVQSSTVSDAVWSTLFERQMRILPGRASTLFFTGIELVQFDPHRLPNREMMFGLFAARGWALVPAEDTYLTDDQWFAHFARKEFPVTNYIRTRKELDFTPLPDMFHDYFGHFAFLMHEEILDVAERLGKLYHKVPRKERHKVGRIWWHTIEFGLIREEGEVRALGAGLISSHQELFHCMQEDLQRPFDINVVMDTPKAVSSVHQQYFVLESLAQLRRAISRLQILHK